MTNNIMSHIMCVCVSNLRHRLLTGFYRWQFLASDAWLQFKKSNANYNLKSTPYKDFSPHTHCRRHEATTPIPSHAMRTQKNRMRKYCKIPLLVSILTRCIPVSDLPLICHAPPTVIVLIPIWAVANRCTINRLLLFVEKTALR